MPYGFEFIVPDEEKPIVPIKNLLRIEGRSEQVDGSMVCVRMGGQVLPIPVPGGLPAYEVAHHLATEIRRLFSVECQSYCLKEIDGEIDGLVLVKDHPDWSVAGLVEGLVLSSTDLEYSSRYYRRIELGVLGLNFGASNFGESLDVFVLDSRIEGGFDALTGIPGEYEVAGMADRIFLPADSAWDYKILLAHELAHALTHLQHKAGGLLAYPAEVRLYSSHRDLIFERKGELLNDVARIGDPPTCRGLEDYAPPSFMEELRQLRRLETGALMERVTLETGGLKYYALRLLVARNEHLRVANFIRDGIDRSRLSLFALYVEDAPSFVDILGWIRANRELEPDQIVGLTTLQRVLSLEERWEAERRDPRILIHELRRAFDPTLPGFAPWDPIFGGHPAAVWAARRLAPTPDEALAVWRHQDETTSAQAESRPPLAQALPAALRESSE